MLNWQNLKLIVAVRVDVVFIKKKKKKKASRNDYADYVKIFF